MRRSADLSGRVWCVQITDAGMLDLCRGREPFLTLTPTLTPKSPTPNPNLTQPLT
jgi:hypothetical protein